VIPTSLVIHACWQQIQKHTGKSAGINTLRLSGPEIGLVTVDALVVGGVFVR
jgi:hypothetical protein